MHCELAATEKAIRGRGAGRPRATVKVPTPAERDLEARLALLVCSFAKGREAELLAGLVAGKRGAAMRAAEDVARLSSSVRQARLAEMFSERVESSERVRRLLEEATASLAAAALAVLPPYLRPATAKRESGTRPAEAALAAFAARLVKEATR